MSENRNTIPTNIVRLIIAATLLFVSYSSFSQTNEINVSPFTLDVNGGVNLPAGDFKDYATNGYQVGLMLNKEVYKNLGLGISANYNNFGIKENLESPDNAWSSISLAVGRQYTFPINMLFIQLYGHIGMSLFKTPGIIKDAENIPDYFEKFDEGFFNTLKIESENNTGLHTDVGIKLGAQLSSKVRLFIGSSYNTSLNSFIKYSSRDISKAFHPSGEVEIDVIRSTPFEEKSIAFSSFNVSAGISINLGKTSTATPAQDYNSSRSNRPTPIREINENDTVQRSAQDYNSSRSNKPRPVFDIAENDTVQRPAQDYNSSRSNKPSPIAWTDDEIENDSVPRPLYAQDYNSSRSNRPTPIREINENDTVQRSAQDYNSSRSNKPSPIAWTDDEIENDSVQAPIKDYNASRRDYDAKRPKEPRSITPPDDESGNDSVQGSLYAQDYNSSRSNKPSPIAWTDDEIENDSVPRPLYAQDYNSSRSNRPTPIREINENDTVQRSAQDYNSSRSNKPRPIFDIAENDTVQRPAQDYNSSRSNRPTPISVIDDINDINNDEDEVVVIGKLITIDLKSRSFVLVDKKKQKISGQFQSIVTNEEIKKLRRNFLNKQANIHVKINKTKLETGKKIISYEL